MLDDEDPNGFWHHRINCHQRCLGCQQPTSWATVASKAESLAKIWLSNIRQAGATKGHGTELLVTSAIGHDTLRHGWQSLQWMDNRNHYPWLACFYLFWNIESQVPWHATLPALHQELQLFHKKRGIASLIASMDQLRSQDKQLSHGQSPFHYLKMDPNDHFHK